MKDKQAPFIRFKEFTDAWEQRKLSEVASSFEYGLNAAAKEYDGVNKYIRITDIDDLSRVFKDDDLTSPDTDLSAASNYKLHDGEILFARTGASVGKSFIYRESDGHVYFAGFLIRAKIKSEYDPEFVFQNTLGVSYEKYIQITSQRSGQPGVNAQEYGEYTFLVPDYTEQKKIGGFLRQLDNLITLHQRKHDKLVSVKKAMLEKMFPKNESKVPKIRFKGFTDDWEQRKLGDISSLITKGTTPKDKSGTGDVNFIKVENINDFSGNITGMSKISLEEHQGYLKRSQLQEGDILFSIAGTLGRVTSVNKAILPANTNQALSIIRLKEGNLEYVKTCLKGNVVADFIRKNPTIGAQPNLSLEQVSNLKIEIPSETEQKKIGEYFSNLDNLITLHQRELEKLQNIKKSCLKKMFV